MSTETRVKKYDSAKDMERDIQKMSKDGWQVVGQGAEREKVAVGRTAAKTVLTGGIGLLVSGRSKKGGDMVVTYQRGG